MAEAGDALLECVLARCIDPPSDYRHAWYNGDMVAWDNWRILHNAEGTPVEHTRLVQRIGIKGDYGSGRLAGLRPFLGPETSPQRIISMPWRQWLISQHAAHAKLDRL
jgi:hypothetical protein